MQNILARFEDITLTLSMTAEEGLGKVRELKPDLIILDINLPGMSGWEALSHIQEMPEAAGTLVIALTASASQEDIKRGRKLGFILT